MNGEKGFILPNADPNLLGLIVIVYKFVQDGCLHHVEIDLPYDVLPQHCRMWTRSPGKHFEFLLMILRYFSFLVFLVFCLKGITTLLVDCI